ncbi:MAG: YncE family protein, partial [Candidatus Cloacimonetes bacterium]|nr:YncE family protein [Candidatus Cloacimonadota bacterium]
MFNKKRQKIIILIVGVSALTGFLAFFFWRKSPPIPKKSETAPKLTLQTSIPTRTNQGMGPTTMAISLDGKYVLIGTPKGACTGQPPSGSQSNLTLVSSPDFSVVKSISFDDWLLGFTFTPDSKKIVAANSYSDKVTIFSIPSLEKIAEIPAGPVKAEESEFAAPVSGCCKINAGYKPAYVAIGPEGHFAFVSNAHDGSILVIDVNSAEIVQKIELPKYPENKSQSMPLGILADSQGNYLYVTDRLAEKVFVIDQKTFKLVKEVTVGKMPEAMVFSPNEKFLYVANSGEKTISTIDTFSLAISEIIDLSNINSFPRWLAIEPQGEFLFIGHNEEPFLSIVSTKTGEVVGSLGKETKPWMLAVSPDGKNLLL